MVPPHDSPETPNTPVRSMDTHSWALGAMDAFHGRPRRDAVNDPLAYASGRVEGEAWRMLNLDLGKQLRRNKLPYPI